MIQICGHGDIMQTENYVMESLNPSKKKTPFSNVSKISAGHSHSLFQNNDGKIFACGYNSRGQCGLGHFDSPQITPSLIPNLPSNIAEFIS